MKLAEALQERSDLNYKISDLELRLTQNSLVQEGKYRMRTLKNF